MGKLVYILDWELYPFPVLVIYKENKMKAAGVSIRPDNNIMSSYM